VFCQADGNPFELWHLTARLRRAARKAGLRRLHWHGLRHSFASQAVIMGITLKQIQEWLGHASIMMTMRYAHLAPNTDQVRLVAMLDRAGEAK
jgi:site-specific recombinase XerD